MDQEEREQQGDKEAGFRERLLMGGPRTVWFCVALLLLPWAILAVVAFWLAHFSAGPWVRLPLGPFITFTTLSLVNLMISIGVLEGCHGLTRQRCRMYRGVVFGAGVLPALGFALYIFAG